MTPLEQAAEIRDAILAAVPGADVRAERGIASDGLAWVSVFREDGGHMHWFVCDNAPGQRPPACYPSNIRTPWAIICRAVRFLLNGIPDPLL